MKTFLCYIHSLGVQTPQLRMIAAPDPESLPEAIRDNLGTWPTFASIELVEICTESNELLLSYRPEANPSCVH